MVNFSRFGYKNGQRQVLLDWRSSRVILIDTSKVLSTDTQSYRCLSACPKRLPQKYLLVWSPAFHSTEQTLESWYGCNSVRLGVYSASKCCLCKTFLHVVCSALTKLNSGGRILNFKFGAYNCSDLKMFIPGISNFNQKLHSLKFQGSCYRNFTSDILVGLCSLMF